MMEESKLIASLFSVLFVFIGLNAILSFTLLYINKRKIYVFLSFLWPMLLFQFAVLSVFQKGELEIALAYSVAAIPAFLNALIAFEVIGRIFPVRRYVAFHIGCIAISILFWRADLPFEAFSMPIVIGVAAPMFHAAVYILGIERRRTTILQKVMAGVLLLMVGHGLNFALFRMRPEAQLWGWVATYGLYDALAILLPAMSLEFAHRSENRRLNTLVTVRTADLEKTINQNNHLLKILMHDVSNPLFAIKGQAMRLITKKNYEEDAAQAILSNAESISKILIDVKDQYKNSKNSPELSPVEINECFNELGSLFAETLKTKDIKIVFHNLMKESSRILGDKTALTYSVLGNLISNSLKFSNSRTTITVSAEEVGDEVILKVLDQGSGIGPEIVRDLTGNQDLTSTPGNFGETGSGFGLMIVKKVVESFNGSFGLYPNSVDNKGTVAQITLRKTTV